MPAGVDVAVLVAPVPDRAPEAAQPPRHRTPPRLVGIRAEKRASTATARAPHGDPLEEAVPRRHLRALHVTRGNVVSRPLLAEDGRAEAERKRQPSRHRAHCPHACRPIRDSTLSMSRRAAPCQTSRSTVDRARWRRPRRSLERLMRRAGNDRLSRADGPERRAGPGFALVGRGRDEVRAARRGELAPPDCELQRRRRGRRLGSRPDSTRTPAPGAPPECRFRPEAVAQTPCWWRGLCCPGCLRPCPHAWSEWLV
jgi:hypothetical protein